VVGCTVEQARNDFTMSQYNRLVEYWERHPPTHLLLGALLDGLSAGASGSPTPPESTRHPADDPDIPSYKNESIESLMARWRRAPGVGVGGMGN
jgi:hypothetical protein